MNTLVVVWRVTERCNLSCKFCAYDRELPGPRREADPEGVRAFGAVLARFAEVTGVRVLVSWLGGEPLLWPPLRALTTSFRREFFLALSTTTNGTTLSIPAMRAHLLENYDELTVSVDGLEGVHDHWRGWPGGFAALRRSVTALAEEKRRAGRGPVLRVNAVLLRETIADFLPLARVLADWGVEEITFNQLGGLDRPEFYPGQRLLPEQVEEFADALPDACAELRSRGVRLGGSPAYLRRIAATTRGVRLPMDDCQPGERFLFIDETGRVAPCSFTSQGYGVPLAEIDSVEALRALPGRFRELRRARFLAPCEDCHSTQVFEKFVA